MDGCCIYILRPFPFPYPGEYFNFQISTFVSEIVSHFPYLSHSQIGMLEDSIGLVAMESSKSRGNVMEKSRMTGVQPLLDFALLSVNQKLLRFWPTEREGSTKSTYAGCSEIIPYINLI